MVAWRASRCALWPNGYSMTCFFFLIFLVWQTLILIRLFDSLADTLHFRCFGKVKGSYGELVCSIIAWRASRCAGCGLLVTANMA